jgi:hypothetical protein
MNIDVDAMSVGLGAVRLPAEVPGGTNLIVIAGLGGGLDPALRVGDVVSGDGIYSSAEPVLTPAQKAELFRATRARVVDMETEAVRAWAAPAGVPVVAVRAVSDTADQAIDPALLRLVDELGRPRHLAIATYLLHHPTGIRRLLRLAAASRLACERLGEGVRDVIVHHRAS